MFAHWTIPQYGLGQVRESPRGGKAIREPDMAKKIVKPVAEARKTPELSGGSPTSSAHGAVPTADPRMSMILDCVLIVIGVVILAIALKDVIEWWYAGTVPFKSITGIELVLGLVLVVAGAYSLSQRMKKQRVGEV